MSGRERWDRTARFSARRSGSMPLTQRWSFRHAASICPSRRSTCRKNPLVGARGGTRCRSARDRYRADDTSPESHGHRHAAFGWQGRRGTGYQAAQVARVTRGRRQQRQRLLEDLRCELARQLLEESRLPIGEIAATLHYSKPGAFSRAFRGWTGKTPRAWRLAASRRLHCATGRYARRVASGRSGTFPRARVCLSKLGERYRIDRLCCSASSCFQADRSF